MAELYWTFQEYEMSPAAQSINDVYDSLATAMEEQGWLGVQRQGDLHGYKPGLDLFAAVAYLPVAGQTFWQGIAVGGGNATGKQAQKEIQQLQDIIAQLNFS